MLTIVIISAGTVRADCYCQSALQSSPRLDPHIAGIASGRRLRRCKKVKRVKKLHLGVYGPPRMRSCEVVRFLLSCKFNESEDPPGVQKRFVHSSPQSRASFFRNNPGPELSTGLTECCQPGPELNCMTMFAQHLYAIFPCLSLSPHCLATIQSSLACLTVDS